jgi:hypothetical protein
MSADPIFLSASVPNKELQTYVPDPVAIREAVRALVGVVLAVPGRLLIFGGHPAISPMVWEDAESLGAVDRVYIYQSELFRPVVPPQAHFFAALQHLVWTPAVPDPDPKIERAKSLDLMRRAMIERRVLDARKVDDPSAPADFPEYSAGVFIGGMDGIEDEWKRFRGRYSKAKALLVASTGGAARVLMADPGRVPNYPPPSYPSPERYLLERDRRYRFVFRTLLPP